MSSEERKQILNMVGSGKISAEEAAQLMHALDDDSADTEIQIIESESASGGERSGPFSTPEFDEVKARAHRFGMVLLWVGVFVTVLSAWGIYSIQQSAGTNFWFYCTIFPLMLGIGLIALGMGGQSSRWLYVNVDRSRAQDGPRNITIGFPLPLGLTSWFLRTFGHSIHGLRNTNVVELIQVLDSTGKSNELFIVNVEDDEEGERVQVYIG